MVKEKKTTKSTTSASSAQVKAKKVVKKAEAEKEIIRKKFDGVVVSNKMDKTIVAKVDSVRIHSKYGKRYTVSRKYMIHDESGKYKIGDKVTFVECRPLSKNKRWRVLSN